MDIHSNELHENRDAAAIGVWENEGGSPSRDNMDHQYGRRIEANRSWTVYHVFTGVPANAGGRTMTGLDRLDATGSMMSLNLRNAGRRSQRIELNAPKMAMLEIEAIQSWH